MLFRNLFAVCALLGCLPVQMLAQGRVETIKILPSKHRDFTFTYAGKVVDLAPGTKACVWIPIASSSPEQIVDVEKIDVPAEHQLNRDPVYDNSILSFEGVADAQGEIPFQIDYRVRRLEVRTDASKGVARKASEAKSLLSRYLQPDEKVPTTGKPLELIKDKKLSSKPSEAAKVMYDVVDGHMKYSKEGTGWGQGDSVWACDSKFGNCTDFHSLFISMARGNKIPSKFEMGFSIPVKTGSGPVAGYHCWAWFMTPKNGWIPVDISEANRHPQMKDYYFGNLTEDRIQFTTGRDLILSPRQAAGPLNFLIYPYVEVEGRPYPAEKVQRSFAYADR